MLLLHSSINFEGKIPRGEIMRKLRMRASVGAFLLLGIGLMSVPVFASRCQSNGTGTSSAKCDPNCTVGDECWEQSWNAGNSCGGANVCYTCTPKPNWNAPVQQRNGGCVAGNTGGNCFCKWDTRGWHNSGTTKSVPNCDERYICL